MKHLVYLFSIAFFITCSENKTIEIPQEPTTEKSTTYYLIRHAEKDRTNPENQDPELNEEGLKRAEAWANIFSEIELDAIYSTDFLRTQQTAKPIAESKFITVKTYDPNEIYDSNFFEITEGTQVLIVGHSNTIPKLANFILNEERYENIPDSLNGKLYVLTKQGDQVRGLVFNLE